MVVSEGKPYGLPQILGTITFQIPHYTLDIQELLRLKLATILSTLHNIADGNHNQPVLISPGMKKKYTKEKLRQM